MSAVKCVPSWDDDEDDATEQRFLNSLPLRLRIVNARSPYTRDGLYRNVRTARMTPR